MYAAGRGLFVIRPAIFSSDKKSFYVIKGLRMQQGVKEINALRLKWICLSTQWTQFVEGLADNRGDLVIEQSHH